ncbi:glycosyltransferase involved in cell wall biosynthesis [Nitrobacteraceae bacterium AZCC 1564]
MKILLLSFYYPPDLSAGSFRASALAKALLQCRDDIELEIITTQPNRYASFASEAPATERAGRLTVHRIPLPPRRGGIVEQLRAFASYALGVRKVVQQQPYDIVAATSSRLMTAALGALVANSKGAPLYLDIRDIFVDTIADVFPAWLAALTVRPFAIVERMTIRKAAIVNLVSGGFLDYFKSRYPNKRFTYHTNGIDEEFLHALPQARKKDPDRRTVLYAGNIGDGQGLHHILPKLAQELESKVTFRLFGDGGRLKLLQDRLQEAHVKNVELYQPVPREQLLEEYANADVLFLHLNDVEAFKKVLPSKLFEYGATGKPIWAGLRGHAAEFAIAELDNTAIFEPCNAKEALAALDKLAFRVAPRVDFLEKYDRRLIMKAMAHDVLSIHKQTSEKT